MTLTSLLVTIIGLIILWIIVSIPVWLAGKAVTGGKATFGEAMIATLFGPIVYAVTLFIVRYVLGASNRLIGVHNRINFSSYSLDMGLQSKLQNGLAGRHRNSHTGMDNLHRNKHNIRSPLLYSSSRTHSSPHLKTTTKH